jgi:hypothetical protein
MADQALNALKDAGFSSDQIRYSGGAGSSAGSFFKSLFTGQNTTKDSFVNDLADMGVPDQETRYYADEYHNGRSIVAVNAPGRVQEALNIMQRYGAYNNYSSAATETTQPANYVQQGSTTPVNANPPAQQRNVPPQAPPPQPPPVQGHPVQGSSQMADKLQELQTQLQATRKQLQDAQVQLQAAKQREAQLQAAKQHEVQVQEAQKQLQDLQAQLQATQAELRATQARIGEVNQ